MIVVVDGYRYTTEEYNNSTEMELRKAVSAIAALTLRVKELEKEKK